MAEPGDTVHLEDGIYGVQLATTRDGEQDSPIIVEGGPGAIINGDISPSVVVTHSYITLKVCRPSDPSTFKFYDG